MREVKRVLLAILTVAACSAQPATTAKPPPSTDPPVGVTVGLGQWRMDEPVHRLQAAVKNSTDIPIYFADVQLVSDSFEILPPARTDATLRRTKRTDLKMPYGAARCRPDGVPPLQPASVVAHIRVGDQPLRKVIFPVPHPDPLLQRLLRDECQAYLIKQVVDLTFGSAWTRKGEELHGTLQVSRRTGTDPVTVVSVDGTTHYQISAPKSVLKGTEQRLEVPVVVLPGRCDPHAFAEAKKAYLFPVRAALGQDEAKVVIVVPDEQSQRLMLDYAKEVCGLP
ncbi:hypothetical protein GCM10022248_03490 [Nonomuraea soli]